MAETYDIGLAPTCPIGPIALAASLQVAASAPNCEFPSLFDLRAKSLHILCRSHHPSDKLASTLSFKLEYLALTYNRRSHHNMEEEDMLVYYLTNPSPLEVRNGNIEVLQGMMFVIPVYRSPDSTCI
jgi:hypothetical protein